MVPCDANQVGEVDGFSPILNPAGLCTCELCFSYKQGFHENQLKGEQKAKASWEACIIHLFPRCFLCTLSRGELFLFRPSAWFSFGWLWFLHLLNTWGQGAFSWLFESSLFFFSWLTLVQVLIFEQQPIFIAIWQSWGWGGPRLFKSRSCFTIGDPRSFSARLPLNHPGSISLFQRNTQVLFDLQTHGLLESMKVSLCSLIAEGTGWGDSFSYSLSFVEGLLDLGSVSYLLQSTLSSGLQFPLLREQPGVGCH